ncbi:MAG: preprotein translocase subunit SecA [Patescibacteria group bacterium]|jgi:preprotein translocase subunit SecA
MGILTKIFGDPNEKTIKSLQPIVDKINSFEAQYEKLSDEELKGMTAVLRGKLENLKKNIDEKSALDEILPEAFAAVREASKRTNGQRHYDVQLIGGIILYRGQIAEMKTGEGKTLVATLPLYLNALAGKGAHLVTVNDYLARVGAGWMAPVYQALGMTTGVIAHEAGYVYDPSYRDESKFDDRLMHLKPVDRRSAYATDIIYGTNNEYGFDYLRDNMVSREEDMVQRELFFAIVDEVDSILIDEARTPLIISAPAEESTDKYFKFAGLVGKLNEDEDYNLDEKMRTATLTENGIKRMEQFLGIENIYTVGGVKEVHHIEQALKARVLFKRDKDYVVKDGEVIIVDEFTGRLMHGRRYSEGLHQAIEAKEGVKVQRESQTLATITFQNYFRMYEKLSGMTGTALTEAEEFYKIYGLETIVIPTHRPMVRKDLNDLIYKTEEAKFTAVAKEVKERHEKGQPVLVGTISIEKNEVLAGLMEREGLRPNVLNAKNHEKEAMFIAEAGKLGAITIATNMAGRGVDIILGGPAAGGGADKAAQKKVLELGGLHVIGTERHEARRIDNQLRGRAGRQGDPGSSVFYVSVEDDLMRIFGGDRMKNIMTTLRVPEDMPIENKLINKSIEQAQKKVEANNFDLRKHLVEYDDVINKHRESVYRRRKEILKLTENRIETAESDIRFQAPNSKFQTNPKSKIQNQKFDAEACDFVGREPKDVRSLSDIILGMAENEIEQVVCFHTVSDLIKDWNITEIYQVAGTIFPVEEKLKSELLNIAGENSKLNKARGRTAIIEHLTGLAKDHYAKLTAAAGGAGIKWPEVEKQVLIRSIDLNWVEHLEAMDYMRRGIGLRGYGQRDPLMEYKKEAYRMFNELNSLIQKQVVYNIFKVGDLEAMESRAASLTADQKGLADRPIRLSAPAKEMSKGGGMEVKAEYVIRRERDDQGEKIGRNDPCPCGSGKKYKKCHGA